MTADEERPIAELAPREASKWKGLGVTLGAMGIVIIGVIVAIAISSTQAPPASAIAPPGGAAKLAEGAVGGEGNPQYNQELASENRRRGEAAASAGESFIPTPVGEVAPEAPIRPAETAAPLEKPEPPSTTVSLPSAPMHPEAESPRPVPAYAGGVTPREDPAAMTQYLADLEKAWRVSPHGRQSAARVATSASEPDSDGAANAPGDAAPRSLPDEHGAGRPASMPIAVGDVLYAVNAYEVNSDIGSRAVARVVAGPLRDATFLGQFKLEGEFLVLEYNALALPDGTVLDIEAVAVDPSTRRMATRSDIDRHTLARWGAFLAGTWLGTYGEKLEQAGTTTVTTAGGGGTTTVTEHPALDAGEINLIAVGRLGKEIASEVRGGLDRAPTVRLAADAELAVLVLAAPGRDALPRQAQNGS